MVSERFCPTNKQYFSPTQPIEKGEITAVRLPYEFQGFSARCGHGSEAADARGVCEGDDAFGRGHEQRVDVLESVVVAHLLHPVGHGQEHEVAFAPAFAEAPELLEPAVPEHGDPVQTVESRRIGAGSKHKKHMSTEVI